MVIYPKSNIAGGYDFMTSKKNSVTHVYKVIQWSLENRVQLNTGRCREIQISFAKFQQEFDPILMNGDALEVLENVKLLGLNISSNLT